MQNFNSVFEAQSEWNNLKNLTDDLLWSRTKSLVSEERKLTLVILHHLREVNRRRLYSLRGYPSLFAYVTQELGYSEGAAHRRISAMWLTEELPEVEQKIESGELNLSNVAQAQRLFQNEARANHEIPIEQKKEILKTLENKTTRDAERELIQYSSQPVILQKPDRVEPLTEDLSQVRFVADAALLDQLQEIRNLLGNAHPNLSLAELVKKMAEITLIQLRPKSPKNSAPIERATQEPLVSSSVRVDAAEVPAEVSHSGAEVTIQSKDALNPLRSRAIPSELRRQVLARDQGQCQYQDEKTGRKCRSRFAIQIEHKIPFGKGGDHSLENLECLCRSHNLTRAQETYGHEKMELYLNT